MGFSLFTLKKTTPEIQRIKLDGLTYLSEDALFQIRKCILKLEAEKISGIFIETGCALGGSSILIGLSKNTDRKFNVYDVFGMIPPPSSKDGEDVIQRYNVIKSGNSIGINNNKYYGYENDLKTKVIRNFSRYGLNLINHNINLIEGLYQDTLIINEKVAFAHIDCDWYESVMTCLQQIVPHLSYGATVIVDDYYTWSGCQKATDEYFANIKKCFRFSDAAQKLHIKKIT